MRSALALALALCVLSAAWADSFSPPGPSGVVMPYTSSGVGTGSKVWDGKVTSTTSGTWSADFSAAGCTTAPTISVQPVSPDAALANSSTATLTAVSTTSAGGNIFQPNTIALGGTPYKLAAVALTVHVIAICR